ncbi:hypothetical protein B0T10DRAFT_94008 [Thelonectria olida]|uniref:Uncharacterized protein n=1 Tax=Thelonectria olida TaxID=1576542 RepID=A0A9P8VZT4_9HYPO|nr:hypothetical protein B0T10DRAFT_94008 [Thelonectria olida]
MRKRKFVCRDRERRGSATSKLGRTDRRRLFFFHAGTLMSLNRLRTTSAVLLLLSFCRRRSRCRCLLLASSWKTLPPASCILAAPEFAVSSRPVLFFACNHLYFHVHFHVRAHVHLHVQRASLQLPCTYSASLSSCTSDVLATHRQPQSIPLSSAHLISPSSRLFTFRHLPLLLADVLSSPFPLACQYPCLTQGQIHPRDLAPLLAAQVGRASTHQQHTATAPNLVPRRVCVCVRALRATAGSCGKRLPNCCRHRHRRLPRPMSLSTFHTQWHRNGRSGQRGETKHLECVYSLGALELRCSYMLCNFNAMI